MNDPAAGRGRPQDQPPGQPGQPGQRGQRGQGSWPPGRPTGPSRAVFLRVNPIACDAHGLCIELLPELIAADPWGYPVIRPGPVPPELIPLARRAARACPTLALLLTRRE